MISAWIFPASGSGMEMPLSNDSVSNDSTFVIGLDIGTYFGYSVTLFVLSLVTAVILVTWAICMMNYNNKIGACCCCVLVAMGVLGLLLALGLVISGVLYSTPVTANAITGVFNGYIAVMALCWMTISLWMSCTRCCILLSEALDDDEYDEDDVVNWAFCLAFNCVLFIEGIVALVALVGGSGLFSPNGPTNSTNSTVIAGSNIVYSIGVAGFSLILLLLLLLVVVVVLLLVLLCYKALKEKISEALEERREAAYTAKTQEAIKARFKSSQSLLEKALRHGFVEPRTVLCLLTGVAGSGKTHTKHLLFRKNPPEDRTSTALAERPVRAVIVCKTSEQFQEVNIDELDKVLANEIAAGVQLENRTSLLCATCFGNTVEGGVGPQSRLHSNPLSIPTSHTPHYGAPSSEFTPHNQRTWCCSMCHEPESELQEATRLALDNTVHLISTSTEPQQLLSGELIYLIDSGGQIEFLEVLPAFLRNMAVCLFIMKLSEKLSDYPKIEYFEDGKSVGEPTPCTLTNEEMLMRCVQTIQSQCVLTDSNKSEASKVVVVGTHRDLEDLCPEGREEKNQKLLSQLSPAFDQSLIFHGQEMKEIIFPINAKNPDSQDRQVASELTNVVSNAASNMKPRKTPISWFKFEQYLQKLAHDQGTRILQRKECLKVARLLHLSWKDFDAALDHLASYCVIHYYWHLLPNVVFIDPQFLPGKISELVKYHYAIRRHPGLHTGTEGDLRKFRNEACITIKLLEQFTEGYTAFFTPADLLKLMKDRLIVAQHISNDEYFMPCLLPTMESDRVEQCRQTSSSSPAATLAIVFSRQCRWVPHGIFCSLVAFLQSSDNSSSWRLSVCPNDSTKPLCLTRNCIKFQFPEGLPGTITLVDAFSHFEVYVNAPHNACVALCPSIWGTLFRGIEKAKENLHYHALEEPKQAFLCKHGSDCYTRPPHLAFPADKLNYWTCEIDPDTMYGCLSEENMVWFPKLQGLFAPSKDVQPFPASDDEDFRPTMLELIRFRGREKRINIPQEISTKYTWFGCLLLEDSTGAKVNNIEHKHGKDAEQINTEILQEWLKGRGKQPVSWRTLIEVLHDVKLSNLASDIEAVKLQSSNL